MSQIFDALLRSEAERGREEVSSDVGVAELLRYVEQDAAVRFTPASTAEGFEVSAKESRLAVLDPAQGDSHPKGFEANVALYDAPENSREIWSEFQPRTATCSSEGRLVCHTDRATPMAEAFRLLTVRLREIRQTKTLNKLLITSTVPREGKSTVAANLACALAQKKEERVLLLEGDIRRPTLSKIFNCGEGAGICQLLQDERHLTECIYHLEQADIWIMPAGVTPATPLELLQSKRLPALMDTLSRLFDWVIVDSPPVLPLADTSIWSQMVDGILLVTRHGITEKHQLERGLKAVEAGKVIGALLNGAQASTYSSYYYSSSAGSKRASR